MKTDSMLQFSKSTKSLKQILQLLPNLDHFDVGTVRDAAKALLTLSIIFSEEPTATFEF